MTDRPWSKDWRAGWRDERLDDCGAAAVALRPCLIAHVVEVSPDGTGWAQNLDGRPMSLAQLGRLVRHDEASTLVGLEQLVSVRIAVRREDGCWGIVGWQKTQESPEAARVRRHRALHVTPAVTPDSPPDVTDPVTVGRRGGEDRGERTELTLSPPAGEREDSPVADRKPPRSDPAMPDTATPREISPPIGQRLTTARELVGTYTQATAAARAEMPLGRLKHIEAGVLLPTREDLLHLARTYGQPEIASWPLPVRDGDLVTEIVAMHRDRAVELGAMAPGSPATATPLLAADVYASEAADLATGLTLRQAWTLVISRAAEELRRDIARGRPDQRRWFQLAALAAEKRRSFLLSAVDLDRRDDLTPAARGSPRRRGPAPPQNPDRLTDGEIPQ